MVDLQRREANAIMVLLSRATSARIDLSGRRPVAYGALRWESLSDRLALRMGVVQYFAPQARDSSEF